MILYHFTAGQCLYGIAKHGLTVGDVPTDLRLNKGRVGVWLTSDSAAAGHGLESSLLDKSRFRLSIDVEPGDPLFRWIDWAPGHATPLTIDALHCVAPNFATWWVYFGVIPRRSIFECLDTHRGEVIPDWASRERGPLDQDPVPPEHRKRWHRKLLRNVSAALTNGRRSQKRSREG